MPRRKLREALDRLHNELHEAPVDPEDRELLLRTAREIESFLDDPGEPLPPRDHLVDALGDSLRRFEVSHPTLASVIGRMIDILAQAGI